MNGTVGMLLANNNTSDVAEGLGFIKGSNCTIKEIEPILGENGKTLGNKIVFEWTGTAGTKQSTSIEIMNGTDGADGTGTGDDPDISEGDINSICSL